MAVIGYIMAAAIDYGDGYWILWQLLATRIVASIGYCGRYWLLVLWRLLAIVAATGYCGGHIC